MIFELFEIDQHIDRAAFEAEVRRRCRTLKITYMQGDNLHHKYSAETVHPGDLISLGEIIRGFEAQKPDTFNFPIYFISYVYTLGPSFGFAHGQTKLINRIRSVQDVDVIMEDVRSKNEYDSVTILNFQLLTSK